MVSIILPNLNTPLNFLEERISSIKKQFYTNWNCIIVDGFSTNGSAEYLRSIAESDTRFQFNERPKKGIYDAWNEGIKLATASYVYIATSDDTMLPELLEKMVASLNLYTDCSIAHCGLSIINEKGNLIEDNNWENYWTSQYFGDLNKQKHKRIAPHDGILHMAVQTVYTSITQLLVRKEVFEKIGLFRTDGGPIADFEFGMRASLLFNTVHIPEKLATWRIHSQQATSNSYNDSAAHRNNLCNLALKALLVYKKNKPEEFGKYNFNKLFYVFRRDQFYYELNSITNKKKQVKLILRWLFLHPKVIINYILAKLRIVGKHFDRIAFIRDYIIKNDLDKNVVLPQL